MTHKRLAFNVLIFLCPIQILLILQPGAKALNLTLLHTNDVQSRFLSSSDNQQSGKCETQQEREKNKCWGGAARRQTLVKEIRGKNENVLLLDAGNQFMGWFFVWLLSFGLIYQFRFIVMQSVCLWKLFSIDNY